MRILIEEHQYPAEVVENIIVGLTNLRNIKGKVSVNHVGYYYNPALNGRKGDMVFILPDNIAHRVPLVALSWYRCRAWANIS